MDERPRYDEKLAQILKEATVVFAEKGYHRASIRDIASATGVSLSGLYYYFNSKEELLYLIQVHCFETLLERAREQLDPEMPPEARLRLLVRNHLRFFLSNMREMKVLSHEADILSGRYLREVGAMKRDYVDLLAGILEELRPDPNGADVRIAALSLFGMLNWIYTWYRPDRDPGAEELTDQMLHIFLNGFRSGEVARTEPEMVGGEEDEPSIWRNP